MDQANESSLTYLEKPRLKDPVMLVCFSGWADAGEASTGTIKYFLDHLQARPLAEIGPEKYFDHTNTRPAVCIEDGLVREYRLLKNQLFYARGENGAPDVICMLGVEIQFNWDHFCAQVLGLAKEMGVREIYTVGATYYHRPHWLEPTASIIFYSRQTRARFWPRKGLRTLVPSEFEGSASFHIYFSMTAEKAGLPVVTLWGHCPVYLKSGNYTVIKLLVVSLNQAAGLNADTAELDGHIASMHRHVARLLAENPHIHEFIEEMEHRFGPADVQAAGGWSQAGDPPEEHPGKVLPFTRANPS